ncbi:hypothetical protein WAI453_001223 [Rhynchosporium graminicola]
MPSYHIRPVKLETKFRATVSFSEKDNIPPRYRKKQDTRLCGCSCGKLSCLTGGFIPKSSPFSAPALWYRSQSQDPIIHPNLWDSHLCHVSEG